MAQEVKAPVPADELSSVLEAPTHHEWSPAQEADVRKAIARAFYDKPEPALPADKEPERWCIVDVGVMMLEALSARAKQALRPFIPERQATPPTITQIPVGGSMISLDLLLDAFGVVKASRDKGKGRDVVATRGVGLYTGHNFPMFIQTADWRILIAPRIKTGE